MSDSVGIIIKKSHIVVDIAIQTTLLMLYCSLFRFNQDLDVLAPTFGHLKHLGWFQI